MAMTLFACNNDIEQHDVYVTVYPMEYVAASLLEGTEKSVGIVPGVSSHETATDWSAKEIIAMTDADLLFYVGGNYDQYIDIRIDIFEGKTVELVKFEDHPAYITFIEGVVHDHDHDHDEEDDHDTTTTEEEHTLGIDPHFWISPLRVQQATSLIYEKLIATYPDLETTIEANYTTLMDDLQQLNDDFDSILDNGTKPALTSTNLYGYLEADYGLDYIPISPGFHEEAESFTVEEKNRIVNAATEHGIRHIIYEKYTNSPLSDAIFRDLEEMEMDPVKLEFHVLQMITDENEDAGEDYITIMYDNLEVFETAIGYQTTE
jgi:zinc transport system substrate-binding protein